MVVLQKVKRISFKRYLLMDKNSAGSIKNKSRIIFIYTQINFCFIFWEDRKIVNIIKIINTIRQIPGKQPFFVNREKYFFHL